MVNKKHIGQNFDEFLKEEGLFEEAEAVAIKRVLIYELQEKAKRERISKTKLAIELETSRSAIDRLFDPCNTSITLKTMEKIAKFLGKKLVVSFT